MPIIAYADGSGIHDSDITTLAVCAIDISLVESFNLRWNAVLERYGLKELHMKEIGTRRNAERQQMICDFLNVVGRFHTALLYLRTCSVAMEDYNAAKRRTAKLKTAEELCVDSCLGGLSIPAEDVGEANTVVVKFDCNEPFVRWMDKVWRKARKNRQGGWPRQVQSIEPASSIGNPGIQVADMFGWALRRHQTRMDEPQLFAASFLSIRHSACTWEGNPDFAGEVRNLSFR